MRLNGRAFLHEVVKHHSLELSRSFAPKAGSALMFNVCILSRKIHVVAVVFVDFLYLPGRLTCAVHWAFKICNGR
jgi:hypothetical protein